MGQFLLPVPFETAQTDPVSYAGARVMRMILRSLGGNPLPVDQIFAAAHALNASGENWPFWYIDPGAMHQSLNNYDPRGPGHWVVYQNPGQPNADTQLRSTLDNYQVAAATLVNAGQHWVCAVGYTFDDATNATKGFIYNDPAYDGGGKEIAAALSEWNAAFTPVGGGKTWLNKIVEVGDPQPIQDPAGQVPRRILRPGDRLLDPGEAIELAIQGAGEEFGELPLLSRALRAGRPGEPRLVSRLDRRGAYYYLVPLETGGDRPAVLGCIAVDARFGDVTAVSAGDEPFALWPISGEEAVERVRREPLPIDEPVGDAAGRLLDAILAARDDRAARTELGLHEMTMAALAVYAQPREYLVFAEGEVELDRQMVWAPCGHVSMFHPYYVVHTPERWVYVNAYSGEIKLDFGLCRWRALGA